MNQLIGAYLERETGYRLDRKQVSHNRSMMGLMWRDIIAREALRNMDALYVDQEASDEGVGGNDSNRAMDEGL